MQTNFGDTTLGDWLGGLGTASWFFLPIAASSMDGRMIMMWEPRHTAGLFVAWIAVAAVGAGALRVARSTAAGWLRVVAVTTALAPAAPSAFNLVARRFGTELNTPSSLVGWLVSALEVCLLAFLLVLVFRRGLRSLRAQARNFLAISSALIVPFWIGVVRLSVSGRAQSQAPQHDHEANSPAAPGCDVDVVLLDELSYGAVFSNHEPSRPSLTGLVASARVYHHAISPATATMPSVASYLTGLSADRIRVQQNAPLFIREDHSLGPIAEALGQRGLFYDAKRLGYRTEVFGWSFPYCEALGDTADTCRNVGMYNAATLDDALSPLAPFVTIANMWPYQWPTGLFKRPAAVWLHGTELDLLRRYAASAPGRRPTFRWVHFNVPHRPWLEGNGLIGAGAFEANPRRYEAQLRQVDRAVTSFLDGLRVAGRYDDATIVVTSDHGARSGLGSDDPRWVPLIIRPARGSVRQDFSGTVEVRNVLHDVLSSACEIDR